MLKREEGGIMVGGQASEEYSKCVRVWRGEEGWESDANMECGQGG